MQKKVIDELMSNIKCLKKQQKRKFNFLLLYSYVNLKQVKFRQLIPALPFAVSHTVNMITLDYSNFYVSSMDQCNNLLIF